MPQPTYQTYAQRIRAAAPAFDPRHIEAYMRLEHSTLDGLSREQFAAEIVMAAMCIAEGGTDAAERLARSFGM